MNIWQSVRIAGRALRVNKLRSALTMRSVTPTAAYSAIRARTASGVPINAVSSSGAPASIRRLPQNARPARSAAASVGPMTTSSSTDRR